jgi:hypothetical protein
MASDRVGGTQTLHIVGVCSHVTVTQDGLLVIDIENIVLNVSVGSGVSATPLQSLPRMRKHCIVLLVL